MRLKTARDQRIARDRDLLHALFPGAFAANGAKHKKPLKIGIHHDLMIYTLIGADGIALSHSRIRQAVRDYCSGPKYLRALLSTSVRYDLDGQPAGVVAEHERKHAEVKLRAMTARFKGHKKAAAGGTVVKEAA